MALFSASDLKTFIGITDTSEDTSLAQIVAGVDAAAKKYLQRKIETNTYTEYFSGNRMIDRLYAREYPLTAVAGIWVDPYGYFGHGPGTPFADSTLMTLGVDYVYERLDEVEQNVGEILLLNAFWSRTDPSWWLSGTGNIKITYTGGYATVPDDIKLACLLLGAVLRGMRESGQPLQGEHLGDYSYQALSGMVRGAPQEIANAVSLLKPYRRINL